MHRVDELYNVFYTRTNTYVAFCLHVHDVHVSQKLRDTDQMYSSAAAKPVEGSVGHSSS